MEHLAKSYARGPESDPDGLEAPVPELISISRAVAAVTTVRSFAERQKEDSRRLIRQLGSLERAMKALQVTNCT